MKLSKITLLAAAAVGLATSGSASATVYIGTQLNGGAIVTKATGPTAAVWNGNVASFTVVTATGAAGVLPALFNTSVLLKKANNKPAATLDVWLTETGLTSLTGTFISSFTNNVLPPAGWTITESTYYSASNAIYGGTLLGSQAFTGLGATSATSGVIPLTGPFSVTHRYHLATNTTGGSALATIALSSGAVPEPATWAMMLGGFGLAGAAMRRRAAKVAFAA